MTEREMMEIARRLHCVITMGEVQADAVYSMDKVPTPAADLIATDAAIMADCSRFIAATLSSSLPGFADTFRRAEAIARQRAQMMMRASLNN